LNRKERQVRKENQAVFDLELKLLIVLFFAFLASFAVQWFEELACLNS